MATTNTVWVVIICDQVTDRLRSFFDKGHLSEANLYTQKIHAFTDKLKKYVAEKGGTLYVCLPERQILEIPITVAKEVPYFLEGYKEIFGSDKVAIGIGLDFAEAAGAAKKSRQTNNIELYMPNDERITKDENAKSALGEFDEILPIDSAELNTDTEFLLPPNLFDPELPPKREKPTPIDEPRKVAVKPDVMKELQAEAQYVSAVTQTMGGDVIAQQQQQLQQMIQQQQQEAQQPRDLREALAGGQVDGYEPQQQQPQEAPPEEAQQEAPPEEGDKSTQKLYELLANVQERIPNLMELHDKNPEAFKQSMGLIQKLLNLARTKKSELKFEEAEKIEDLEKKIKAGIHRIWPDGTMINRRQKVRIGDKAVWRSVASGLTQDAEGKAISVKHHNDEADGDQDDTMAIKSEKEDKRHSVKIKGVPGWHKLNGIRDLGSEKGNAYEVEGHGDIHQDNIEDMRLHGEPIPST